MNTSKNPKILDLINTLGLGSIAFIVIMYTVFGSSFAENNVQFPFLNFPIFVGEILIAVDLILLGLKWQIKKFEWQKWFWLIILYIIWVLTKAILGYVHYGPLALRNAALFYYPIFILFGFSFFNSNLFSNRSYVLMTFLFFLFIKFNFALGFSLVPYTLFYFIILRKVKSLVFQIGAFLVAVISFPWLIFFDISRSHLVGFAIMIFVFFYYLVWVKFELKKPLKWSLVALFILAGIFMGNKFVDKNYIRSMSNFNELSQAYHARLKEYDELLKIYPMRDMKVKLYRPNKIQMKSNGIWGIYQESNSCIKSQSSEDSRIVVQQNTSENTSGTSILINQPKPIEVIKNRERTTFDSNPQLSQINKTENINPSDNLVVIPSDKSEYSKSDNLDHDKINLQRTRGNIIFRLFIWHDMMTEILNNRGIFGISFGKPLRSKLIETLHWAYDEWNDVGWITPHNSYLHYIYRGGIVGLFIIISLISSFVFLLKQFYRLKDTCGVLLTGALIYGAMLANFGVILELPQHAIPFWSLFGLTIAYCYSQLKKRGYCELEK